MVKIPIFKHTSLALRTSVDDFFSTWSLALAVSRFFTISVWPLYAAMYLSSGGEREIHRDNLVNITAIRFGLGKWIGVKEKLEEALYLVAKQMVSG